MSRKNSRKERKLRVLQIYGWKCHNCGLEGENPAVYDLHHRAGKLGKDDCLDKMCKVGEDIFENWLSGVIEKCWLVCANCHRKIHSKED